MAESVSTGLGCVAAMQGGPLVYFDKVRLRSLNFKVFSVEESTAHGGCIF